MLILTLTAAATSQRGGILPPMPLIQYVIELEAHYYNIARAYEYN